MWSASTIPLNVTRKKCGSLEYLLDMFWFSYVLYFDAFDRAVSGILA